MCPKFGPTQGKPGDHHTCPVCGMVLVLIKFDADPTTGWLPRHPRPAHNNEVTK